MAKITRIEIEKKHGIHKNKLANIIMFQHVLKFPVKVGISGGRSLYDEDDVAEFFKQNPHEKIAWVRPETQGVEPLAPIDNDLALRFIRGEYSHRPARVDNAKRRQAHSGIGRKTVRIIGCAI